jgi:hypothetical protein
MLSYRIVNRIRKMKSKEQSREEGGKGLGLRAFAKGSSLPSFFCLVVCYQEREGEVDGGGRWGTDDANNVSCMRLNDVKVLHYRKR